MFFFSPLSYQAVYLPAEPQPIEAPLNVLKCESGAAPDNKTSD